MSDFNCCDFVDVAEDLLTGNSADNQAHLRTIAGRSYYAVYGLIRRLLTSRCHHKFGKSGKHGQIIVACEQTPINTKLKEIGQWVKDVQKLRVRADYQWDVTSNITTTEAEDAIDSARTAIQLINALSASDLRSLSNRIPQATV